MRLSDKKFYHALNVACIDVLECDLPLDIGFGIQNFIQSEPSRWRRRWGYNRGRMIYVDRLCDLPKQMNNHTESKMPLFKKSSAGAGHW